MIAAVGLVLLIVGRLGAHCVDIPRLPMVLWSEWRTRVFTSFVAAQLVGLLLCTASAALWLWENAP